MDLSAQLFAAQAGFRGHLDNWDFFQGVLLQVHFRTHDGHGVYGSAVLVAPGVALAAEHVFRDYWSGMEAGEVGCLLTGIAARGRLEMWRPTSVTRGHDDIVLVSIDRVTPLPSDNIIQLATISTRIPAIGETLMVCGFRAPEPAERLDSDKWSFRGDVHIYSGTVSDYWPVRRDTVILRSPGLQVDCPTLGSMSGGPVFDQRGFLIGTLTSSWNDNDGPSFVSLAWPVLARRFSPTWPQGLHPPEGTSLLAMTTCAIDSRDAVSILLDENGAESVVHRS